MTYESAEVSGMPTLMRDGQPVAYLDGAMLLVSPWFAEQALGVLTRVLAADEATVERLAEVLHMAQCGCRAGATSSTGRGIRAVLAALADTSAQARHTDNETGGA